MFAEVFLGIFYLSAARIMLLKAEWLEVKAALISFRAFLMFDCLLCLLGSIAASPVGSEMPEALIGTPVELEPTLTLFAALTDAG